MHSEHVTVPSITRALTMTSTQLICLITGASSGMGKDFAQTLLDQGHIVYAAARRTENMKELSDRGATVIKTDISQEEDICHLIDTIKKKHSTIDVLINNAGFGLYGSVEETDMNDARYQFEVNMFGLASLTQKVIPMMRSQKKGRIINVSSICGKICMPLGAWYHATKYALEGWSDCLRIELAPLGIDVVVIEPGGVETEFGDNMAGELLERSGQGPYATTAEKYAKIINRSGKKGHHPRVITHLIMKAIQSKNPKTRYVAGEHAHIILFLRRWLSDRMFDRIIKLAIIYMGQKR